MSNPLTYPQGVELKGSTAIKHWKKYTVNLTPALVAADSSAEETFAVAGVQSGDFVFAWEAPNHTHIGIGHCRVDTPGNIEVGFNNPAASGQTPTAGNYSFLVFRT